MKTYTKEEAKKEIEKLVEFYEKNKSKIQIGETMIRGSFIDLFFMYLNWDIHNQNLLPLTEKFVYAEEQISVNGNKKQPDYTFCQGNGGINNRAFFVEAKKPAVNIDKDFEPAFQVRRYGWSAGLYISVLTNFEHFAIYNTKNIKPHRLDLVNIGRVEFIHYTKYIEKFDELWELFEFNNVQKGSIIEYAKMKGIISDTFVKGEATVDNAFLQQIENWRQILANAIKGKEQNDKITNDKEKLNFAVQKIIDRIIFLRIIEDRGLEQNETLLKASENYKTLCELFDYADEKYNSGLFHFNEEIGRGIPDTITKDLHIWDKVIKGIIEKLYQGNPYAFDVMPAYILGSVYERFLGKEIDISGRGVTVDAKPEVRKAGGVYYTPEYIANYIVENTVERPVIASKAWQSNNNKIDCHAEAARNDGGGNSGTKILDPACGSGSFLLVAYQYMLDFYQRKKPHSLLTLQERKQILLDHIFGVDLDEQAVEVTKLSLLLKVLEGITKEEIKKLSKKEYVLPDLYRNIKCGNSLIDDTTVAGAKAFVWEKEFPEIFNSGGFDCVIGNPPYVQLQKDKEGSKKYSNYKTYSATGDIYCIFYEQGIKLLKQNGTLGFITSNKWLRAGYGEKLRGFFIQYNPTKLLDFSEIKIFEDATVDCNILILQKKENKQNTIVSQIKKDFGELNNYVPRKNNFIIRNFNTSDIWTVSNGMSDRIKEKIIKAGTPLKNWDINIFRGLTTGLNEAFVIDEEKRTELIFKDPKSNEIIKPILRGRDIKKYNFKWNELYVILAKKGINISDFPAIFEHLKNYKNKLKQKAGNNKWYELQASPSDFLIEQYETQKVIFKEMVTESSFIFDNYGEFYCIDTARIITGSHLKYLLAFFNSKLFFYAVKTFYGGGGLGKSGIRMKHTFFENVPIPKPNKRTENQIIKLVDKILELKKEGKRTEPLERDIDEIVYKLYGLTDDEINIIDGGK